MQSAVALLRVLAAVEDHLILVELPLLDRNVDLDNVLPDDPPGSDVQVSEISALSISNDAIC